jgi:hypothetical protein
MPGRFMLPAFVAGIHCWHSLPVFVSGAGSLDPSAKA